jgi:hypothetical protein
LTVVAGEVNGSVEAARLGSDDPDDIEAAPALLITGDRNGELETFGIVVNRIEIAGAATAMWTRATWTPW